MDLSTGRASEIGIRKVTPGSRTTPLGNGRIVSVGDFRWFVMPEKPKFRCRLRICKMRYWDARMVSTLGFERRLFLVVMAK